MHVRPYSNKFDIHRSGKLTSEFVIVFTWRDVDARDASKHRRHLETYQCTLRFFVCKIKANGGLLILFLTRGMEVRVEHDVGTGGKFARKTHR